MATRRTTKRSSRTGRFVKGRKKARKSSGRKRKTRVRKSTARARTVRVAGVTIRVTATKAHKATRKRRR